MIENGRKTKLAILASISLLMGLGAVAPAFAHSDSLVTSTTCQPSTPCNLATTTQVTDTITFCLHTESSTACNDTPHVANTCPDGTTGTNLGTLCIKVYAAAVGVTCAPTGSALYSTTINLTPSNDHTTNTFTKSVPTLTIGGPGNFVWIVQYSGVSGSIRNGHDLLQLATCEPFTLTGHFPPPPGVPEFPLGMALLLALAIPALLLVRTRFASKISSSPI